MNRMHNEKRGQFCGLKTQLVTYFVLALIVGFTTESARGAFLRVENFDDLALGSIGGQNGWVAGSSNVVAADPAGGENQVLAVTNLATTVRKGLLLPQGTVHMVFLRYRFAEQLSGSFGLSHLSSPSEFSDFKPELSLTSTANDLRIANGDTTGVYDELAEVDDDTWYNVWLLVDNALNTTQVWQNTTPGGVATAGDILVNEQGEDTFGFRVGGNSDLINFYIKTGSGSSGDFGPLYIDDIYLESSSQLIFSNPTEQSADFDQDGDVDGNDFLAWQIGLGTAMDATLADGDADGDRDVDGDDLLIWQDNFGGVSVDPLFTLAAVPESTGLLLAALGILACVSIRLRI